MGQLSTPKARIFRRDVARANPTGSVLGEKQLEVSGDSLDECKKIFDEEWNK